jgi:hypothetical protein
MKTVVTLSQRNWADTLGPKGTGSQVGKFTGCQQSPKRDPAEFTILSPSANDIRERSKPSRTLDIE